MLVIMREASRRGRGGSSASLDQLMLEQVALRRGCNGRHMRDATYVPSCNVQRATCLSPWHGAGSMRRCGMQPTCRAHERTPRRAPTACSGVQRRVFHPPLPRGYYGARGYRTGPAAGRSAEARRRRQDSTPGGTTFSAASSQQGGRVPPRSLLPAACARVRARERLCALACCIYIYGHVASTYMGMLHRACAARFRREYNVSNRGCRLALHLAPLPPPAEPASSCCLCCRPSVMPSLPSPHRCAPKHACGAGGGGHGISRPGSATSAPGLT